MMAALGTIVMRGALRSICCDCPPDALADDVVELQAGDVVLGLDNSGHRLIEAEAAGLFADCRNRGVCRLFHRS